MKNKSLRILLVEDHPIVLRGLKEILTAAYPHASFGEAADFREALAAFQKKKWDLVLLDINIPGRGGLDLLEEIVEREETARVLVVSAYPEEEFAVRAFKLGAAGYLSKNQAAEELVAATKKILAGRKYITPLLAEKLADALSGKEGLQAPHDSLSPRELQVLRLIAGGKTIKQIAADLALSEKTVGTYRTRLAEKTGLSNNVELTRYAFQHGLTQ